MSKKFNAFNITTPASTDYVVGYSGTTETRSLWSSVLTFLQGALNITKLDRNSTNHVQATGAGAGSAPSISAVGGDTNIDLNLRGKGTGSVIIDSPLSVTGGIDFSGASIDLNGAALNTEGGAISTANGGVSLGTGALNMAGGVLNMTGGSFLDIGGTTTLNGTGLSTNLVACTTLSSGSQVNANALSANSATITSATITNLTTSSISAAGSGLNISGELTASAVSPQDVLDASDAGRFLLSTANNITADVGSSQGDGLLTDTINVITTCANAGDAVTLPSRGGAFPPVGEIVIIRNDGANSADVFPNTSAEINSLGANNPFALASGSTAIFITKGNAVSGDWTAFNI